MDAFVSLSELQLKLQPYVVTRHAAARHQLCNTPSLAKFEVNARAGNTHLSNVRAATLVVYLAQS